MSFEINGGQLREAMALRGLDQKDLALLAGVTPAVISKAIRGGAVRGVTFARITRALAAAPLLEQPGAASLLAASREARD